MRYEVVTVSDGSRFELERDEPLKQDDLFTHLRSAGDGGQDRERRGGGDVRVERGRALRESSRVEPERRAVAERQEPLAVVL